MLILQKDGRICVSRGDDACIRFHLNRNGAPYVLEEGDKVTFSVGGLFSRELENPGESWVDIPVTRADTEDVAADPGGGTRFDYDIKIDYAGGSHYTITHPRKFTVMGVVSGG